MTGPSLARGVEVHSPTDPVSVPLSHHVLTLSISITSVVGVIVHSILIYTQVRTQATIVATIAARSTPSTPATLFPLRPRPIRLYYPPILILVPP